MPQVQKATEAGETTQLFIRFLMVQQQQALLALGRHPQPPPGAPPASPLLAKMFIDQLWMLREKTRGNLNSHEEKLLNNIINDLQIAYVEVTGDQTLRA